MKTDKCNMKLVTWCMKPAILYILDSKLYKILATWFM